MANTLVRKLNLKSRENICQEPSFMGELRTYVHPDGHLTVARQPPDAVN
ncbi:hypothetical protein PCC7424_3049 [Gloeothece citriformis PCC 7424]|uniref:Uncharacterized protein n=1 Tax=Gloeothece citriformis (strain PCC 7424) TaxID=65393 RepID=B7KB95_GLOC7|nr:hypothetical protein [Gloeothece citriformis]ACK71451.1 hypothetical protein PCC7424_3049 [Gloeothece citriformis PCC 7424]